MKFFSLIFLPLLIALSSGAYADSCSDEQPFKLTIGEYRYADGYGGGDVNL